jgi:hypothetical protein
MGIADELRKLQELHATGSLTDAEFARAKVTLLAGTTPAPSMASPEDSLTRQRLVTMQIVAGALTAGAIIFLGVVLFVVHGRHNGQGMGPPGGLPIVSLMAVVMLGVLGPLAFIVPGILTKAALRQILTGAWKTPPGADPTAFATVGAKLMAVRQTTMILGLALLEGTAFTGCTAYLMEAQPFVPGVVGVAIVLMLCKFPTAARVRAWLERQAEALTELRQQQELPGA